MSALQYALNHVQATATGMQDRLDSGENITMLQVENLEKITEALRKFAEEQDTE